MLFATGSVLCIISDSPALLFLGRLLAGFGVGLESVVAPILLRCGLPTSCCPGAAAPLANFLHLNLALAPSCTCSEIASDRDRGKITTMHQLFVTIGILVSGLVAYVYVPLAPQHL